ncbi:unnamed protein product [Gadus morhua 'NCC']
MRRRDIYFPSRNYEVAACCRQTAAAAAAADFLLLAAELGQRSPLPSRRSRGEAGRSSRFPSRVRERLRQDTAPSSAGGAGGHAPSICRTRTALYPKGFWEIAPVTSVANKAARAWPADGRRLPGRGTNLVT